MPTNARKALIHSRIQTALARPQHNRSAMLQEGPEEQGRELLCQDTVLSAEGLNGCLAAGWWWPSTVSPIAVINLKGASTCVAIHDRTCGSPRGSPSDACKTSPRAALKSEDCCERQLLASISPVLWFRSRRPHHMPM
eukprot:TRINITY_DN48347_c1_g1_i5.p1 TRINITY_DN48347_c1_g1~~TRINITY_DN48347_c1_g1_i5.p1  ORF type:complete len:138 (-),score=3.36 TRINITY_DN48347_c1_g1_i5:560-973(-)